MLDHLIRFRELWYVFLVKRSEAQIMGIDSFEKHKSCIKCKAKVSSTGQCSRCMMKQRLDRCKEEMIARLMIQADESVIPLTAFTAILQEICQGSEVTEDALLYADDFDLRYSETNVIINVTHSTD